MNFKEILIAIFVASTLSLGFIFSDNGNANDIQENDKEIIETGTRGQDVTQIKPPRKN